MDGDPDLLASDGAFVDLSDWRKTDVSGPDALSWLDRLVTAPVADLAPGRARQALLLSAEGGLRAEFTIAVAGSSVLLLQDPGQNPPVHELLGPYIGLWNVALDDRSGDLAMFSFPGRTDPPEAPGVAYCAPSCLGRGVDMLALMTDRKRLVGSLSKGWHQATSHDVEAWRIASARPRVGIDVLADEIPLGVSLEAAIDVDKAAFVGRESLIAADGAGDRSLLLVAIRAESPVAPGEGLHGRGQEIPPGCGCVATRPMILTISRRFSAML